MNVAIIPARGGSKRIPRKNMKEFCGKPMIAWAIEIAKKSECFEKVVVSTDDEEIAEIAESFGASVPFTRPIELANDYTPTIPVIQHALHVLDDPLIDTACCIYPTAVFNTPQYLQQALTHLLEDEADFVMPVVAYSCPFEKALLMNNDSQLSMKNIKNLNERTQDCELLYHDVGQFYFGTQVAWNNPGEFYDKRVKAIQVPKYRAHDIDTPEDWQLAEIVFSQLEHF